MQSVSVTINQKTRLLFVLALLVSFSVFSQENSPYSRYGIGDLVPSASILSRSMGGISAGVVDYDKRYDLKLVYPKSQTINFLNPASYARMKITSLTWALRLTIVPFATQLSLENSNRRALSFLTCNWVFHSAGNITSV